MDRNLIAIGTAYKVPHGFELPFAGRWLKATRIHAGAVDFTASGGNLVRLGNGSAALLAQHAKTTRAA